MAGQKADTIKNAIAESDESSVKNSTDLKSTMSTITKNNNSPPMAVLPLNPSAKLDQEPNPFEQSFSVAANKKDERKIDPEKKPTLPPITDPSTKGNIEWDSLRTSPLSPSMLQGPANPEEFDAYVNKSTTGQLGVPMNSGAPLQVGPKDPTYTGNERKHKMKGSSRLSVGHLDASGNTMPYTMPNQRNDGAFSGARSASVSSATSDMSITTPADRGTSLVSPSIGNTNNGEYTSLKESNAKRPVQDQNPTRKSRKRTAAKDSDATKKKSAKTQALTPEEEEKRRNFLERNRLAALKCRQRKKQWLSNLQTKVEYLTNDNEQLQMQTNALREEVMNLKTLLLAHKDCPITQGGYNVGQVLKSIPQLVPRQQLQATTGSPIPNMNAGQSIYTSNPRVPFTAATTTAPLHNTLMNTTKFSAVATGSPSMHMQQQIPHTTILSSQHPTQAMVQQQAQEQHPATAACSSGVLRF
ncbi:hypothetical protein EC973_009523 [Apophysomyces ossiformis]|uniref:BZIP domain-containing protein n=1 Tax=Apophysomyces ossiformis TaxID=679940 RepID=A0A8H7EQA5_9FUNG|nr:hypothetical protein EC973_009523 [Apophysomyces ossiformis]